MPPTKLPRRIHHLPNQKRALRNAVADFLEPRRMLSVTAAAIAGPFDVVGNTVGYQLVSSGNVIDSSTSTIIGPATYAGQSCVESDEMGSESGGVITTTEKTYDALNSLGLVSYGSTAVVNEGGTIVDTATTYSTPEVSLPPSMTAGTPYTESTTSTTVTSGAASSIMVAQQTTILTLEPTQQAVSVLGSSYLCYVIDETITVTSTNTLAGQSPITTGPTTSMGQEFFSPKIGLAEFVIGPSMTILTSFSGTMGGGGGGGGGGGVSEIIGELDPNFGTAGLASHDTGFVTTNGVALDGTQSVIIGTVGTAPSESFGITRYNSDGSLDTTFGTSGVTNTTFGTTDDVPTAVDVLPGGQILVAGTATTYTAGVASGSEFAVAEYNANGLLDTSFGAGTGEALLGFASTSSDVLQAMAVTPGGVIYLGGSSNAAGTTGTDFAIAAFNADGSVDTGFGTGGKVLQDFAGGDDFLNSLALQANGDIVGAGSATVGGITEIALARFLPTGKLDTHFGTKGLVTTNVRGVYDSASSVLIQPKGGDIVIGGVSATGSGSSLSSDFVVARYSSSGRIDKSFGGGPVITSFGQPSAVTQLVLQADGDIVASGKTTASLASVTPDQLEVADARYTTKGTLDTSFNTTGKTIIDLSSGVVAATDSHTVAFADVMIEPLDASTLGAQFAAFTGSQQGVVTVTTGGEILNAGSSGANTVEAELIAAGVNLVTTLLTQPPTAVVGGAKGTASVEIAETGTDDAAGTVTVDIEVAVDAQGDGSAPATALPEKISLRQGQNHSYHLSFVYPASVATGDYYLVADVQNGSSPTLADLNPSDELAASTQTVNIAPPFISLQASALSTSSTFTPGKTATVIFTVANAGNVPAKGSTTADLILSTDQTAADGTTADAAKLSVSLSPTKSRLYRVSFKLPTTAVAGTYYLIAVLDSPVTLGAIDQTSSVVVDPTAVNVGG